MKKLKFLALFLFLPLAISCSLYYNAVDKFNEKPFLGNNLPITDAVRGVKNSTPDKHADEEKALIVSAFTGKPFYIGKEPYPANELTGRINWHLKENPSEKNLVYLNSEVNTQYGDVIKALNELRKADIENIGLLVAADGKKDARFYILKVKLPAEPKAEEILVKPNPNTLVINLKKDGKTSLNAEVTDDNKLNTNLMQIFKERETNGVFREGTNEVEKTIIVKAPRSATYQQIVKLVDIATGAGASPVYLQIDDLEM